MSFWLWFRSKSHHYVGVSRFVTNHKTATIFCTIWDARGFPGLGNLKKSQSAIRSALFNFFPRPDAIYGRTFLQEYAIALVGLRV